MIPFQVDVEAEEKQRLKGEEKGNQTHPSRPIRHQPRCRPFCIALLCLLLIVVIAVGLYSLQSGVSDSIVPDDATADDHEDEGEMKLNPQAPKRDLPLYLHRLFNRSYPLLDVYPRSFWPLSLPEYIELLGSIGYPNNDAVCLEPGRDPSQVINVFQGRGFGSNILGLVDDIMYASAHRKRFVLVSRWNQDVRVKNYGERKITLSLAYERMFAFPEENDTLCTNWDVICEGPLERKEQCKGPSHSRVAFPTLIHLKSTQERWFFGARVQLMRLLLRVREPTRRRLDEAIKPLLKYVERGKTSITIHLRRTDKIIEAEPTPAGEYVKAALRVVRDLAKGSLDALIVVTDDPRVGEKVISMFNSSMSSSSSAVIPKMGYVLRGDAASIRPDEAHDEMVGESSIIELLTDLRLMVMSKYFIGTRSSNFGLMACYLRGGIGCFNAEMRAEPYVWNHVQDKLV